MTHTKIPKLKLFPKNYRTNASTVSLFKDIIYAELQDVNRVEVLCVVVIGPTGNSESRPCGRPRTRWHNVVGAAVGRRGG